jgi:hypothetical protein
MGSLRRFVFWEYPRASWQYDIMVALILVFVFVTPLFVSFRDQPRAASVLMLPTQDGYLIETRLLEGVPVSQQAARASELVNARYKTRTRILRVEPLVNAEQEVVGYAAFPNP